MKRCRNAIKTGFLLGLFLFEGGCSPFRFFYYPNKKLYVDPHHLEMEYEMMEYESLNSKKLFALLFKTEQEPHGIVVHFHGNYGNVSNHFLGSQFLVNYGFDVLIFDYQGYGGSEGKSSPKKSIEDGRATVRFAQTLNRSPEKNLFFLGQSLGGAVAIPVMAQEKEVIAAVIEASYPSYRTIARDVLTRSALLWIFYPFYPFTLTKKYDPVRYLDQIPPRPLLFIHGTEDKVVPLKMSEVLYEKAQDPKSLWVVEGAGHIGSRRQEGEVYERRVADFFKEAAGIPTSKN